MDKGGPGFDFLLQAQTEFEYYLPGFDHMNASDELFAMKYAILECMRVAEKKESLQLHGFKTNG